MDSDSIRVFIDELNLQLNLFSFDWMAPIPMSFSDLSRANKVSNKAFRSLNLPKEFRGKLLKELLKTVETGRLKPMGKDTVCSSSKRKQSSISFDIKPAAKCMRTEQHDSQEEDCQSGSSTAENPALMKCEGGEEPESEDQVCSSSKRKQSSSSFDIKPAAKCMRTEQHDSQEEDCQSGSSTAENPALMKCEGGEEPESEDQLDFNDKKVCDAIQNLNAFLEKQNLESLRTVLRKSRDEGELEIGLGIHLFTKLAGKAATKKSKSLRKCPCGCLENISGEDNMWIGSQSTWYGELDILTGNPIKGDSVSVSVDQETADGDIDMQGTRIDVTEQFECEDVSEEGDQGESPGNRTNVEVKYSGIRLRPALNQVVAQAVVFAFTEYNRHKTKGKCIPSILIDKSGFQYVIYNPVDDVLLVSNYMMFGSNDSFDPATGFRPFVVLWMILNHRIFFLKNPSFKKLCVRSGFYQQIADLESFKNLSGYSKNISSVNSDYFDFPNDTPNTISSDGLYWFLNRKIST